MQRTLLAAAAAAALCAASAMATPAPPGIDGNDGTTPLAQLPIATLQATYLACDAHSREQRMDPATAGHCQRVADTLRRRAFGDDLDRMLAWWRARRQEALAEAR